ncbi:MAG: PhoH family protein [Candidatus Omnitrophota bacterium]
MLYGNLDENLRFAEKEYHVRVSARNHRLKIAGDKQGVEDAHRYFTQRLSEYRQSHSARGADGAVSKKNAVRSDYQGKYSFFHRGKIIKARSKNQDAYLEAIHANDVVISVGPAGTGKTYLAMACAVDFLKKKKVSRIVLTRPAVEAGESLGYLPGDLYDKINPYLRPLYDALYDMMEYEDANKYLERGLIEIAPLAYMRGRTINDSFIIMDEAQNCTHAQMKMLLTRLGESAKAVVTGDVTQIDLPGGKKSGLVEAQTILDKIPGIEFVYFEQGDVVRHPLVMKIIHAYDKYENKDNGK